MHDEKNVQDFGYPPPPGGDWSGFNPPVLSSDQKVISATTNILRKKNQKNQKNRHIHKREEIPNSYWSTQEG